MGLKNLFRQVFGLHRFKLHRHLVDGTVKPVWFRQVSVYVGFTLDRFYVYSGFSLERFSVYSGFSLDRLHCISKQI